MRPAPSTAALISFALGLAAATFLVRIGRPPPVLNMHLGFDRKAGLLLWWLALAKLGAQSVGVHNVYWCVLRTTRDIS
jgi:hypothetical protein